MVKLPQGVRVRWMGGVRGRGRRRGGEGGGEGGHVHVRDNPYVHTHECARAHTRTQTAHAFSSMESDEEGSAHGAGVAGCSLGEGYDILVVRAQQFGGRALRYCIPARLLKTKNPTP